jgi:CBS domain containing-hemolysin-like protein
MGYRILVMLGILLANGFFAAAEVALVSARRSRLRSLAESRNAGALAALSLLEKPERLLSVTQVGVTAASLGLGWAGEDTVYGLLISALGPVLNPATERTLHALAFALAFGLISYLHVIVGEVVPKNIAIDTADRMAVIVAPVLLVFARIAAPFIYVIERSAALISRAFGVRESREGGHSAEELKFIIRSSWREGHLESVEESAIQRLLDLADYSAREIMVPRNNIVSVPVDATLDKVLSAMSEHEFSRLPVYDERPENIIGIIHYKDLLPVWQERKWAHDRKRVPRPFRIQRFLRKPLFIPETKPLPQLIADFRAAHTHMGLVVDEYGTVVGLVTLEDVLEQVFGEFADEHDVAPSPPPEAATIEVEGTIPIRDLATQYGIELPSEAGYETLAGFLLFQLGYIPKAQDEVLHGVQRFTILEMDRNRIAQVRIERAEAEAPPDTTETEPAA